MSHPTGIMRRIAEDAISLCSSGGAGGESTASLSRSGAGDAETGNSGSIGGSGDAYRVSPVVGGRSSAGLSGEGVEFAAGGSESASGVDCQLRDPMGGFTSFGASGGFA